MSKGRVIGAVLAVVAVGATATAFAISGSGVTDVQVADVTRDDLAVTVSASGEVRADERVEVYPPTTGTLASVEVTEGQRVHAGQVLAVMDTAPIEVQVAQSEAAYAGAVAQRAAIAKSAPGPADLAAAQAAVDAAQGAYSVANAAYEAAKAGVGAPSAADIAEAQSAVVLAQAAADAAGQAYDAFFTNVYEPAATKTPEMETTLAVLAMAKEQARANLVAAQQAVAALTAARDNAMAIAQAKMARDQSYAAYLGAVSQRDALRKASDVSGAVGSADAAIDAADAARGLANDVLKRAEIVAPIDGIVVFNAGAASALPGLGSAVGGAAGPTPGSSVTPASAPFAIVSFESLLFTAQVDETDIARVEPGMKTTIELNGLAGVTFEAEVDRVGVESVLTPTGGTAFPIHARFRVGDEPVLLGMNGSAEIRIETIGEVVTMPIEALLEEGGAEYVFAVRDGRARRVEIEVGRLTDTSVEILGGLGEGDQVIVSGVTGLEDGAKVRVE